ncbi:hypothetical protein [Streptomyces sp. NBC_01465]|uniref:hypothetical protein n=1 Tax=Streptomyces sp. NBC_01465 TaxID=2903878 RepID=UPI002E320009|nr:hypothetical protein [Streptomyces sp. NBC_01465]
MTETRLTPYARLPRAHHGLCAVSSTVDAYGRAHWLLTEPSVDLGAPYDALMVSADNGSAHETHLSNVQARFPALGALPDGGFVVADCRSRRGGPHVQVFDPLGRCTRSFRVGDAIEELLVDEQGEIWVSYFDEGVCTDSLSEPGIRRWSSTGEPLWQLSPVSGVDHIVDCYALNVDRRATWACPHPDFPLLEIRHDRATKVRTNPVKGARAIAVHGDRIVFFGGYEENRNRLADCRLTETSVETVELGTLVLPDGGVIGRGSRISRGHRIYVQGGTSPDWFVLDLTV